MHRRNDEKFKSGGFSIFQKIILSGRQSRGNDCLDQGKSPEIWLCLWIHVKSWTASKTLCPAQDQNQTFVPDMGMSGPMEPWIGRIWRPSEGELVT